MPSELAKVYATKQTEGEVHEKWISSGAFHADPADERPGFCMVIPPPNVTAPLHLGHALNNTLQDVLIRYRRMNQYATLWMPGTDHAGIATQTVVEKRILAEEGKRRTDFDRNEFVGRIQAWKDEYETTIIKQLKLMGCSCDWERTRFTMDEVCAKAVRETFFRLFSDGLIYRGKRLVNWDPATQTVLADDEVEHEDVHGHFWYFRYPLTDPVRIGDQAITHVTVATTRPETMLGDTAVAMNPTDPRAEALVGKKVRLPIVGREIPIITDDHVVLPDPDSDDEKARFSTGFLKVTPAHDPDDYAIGQRHDLPIINVMAPDGSISDKHGWEDCDTPEAQNLIGMDRFEARQAVVEFFRQEKLLEDVREYTHPVGHSYRSHVPIEPYLSDQWYIAVKKPISDSQRAGLARAGMSSEAASEFLEVREGIEYIKGTDVPVNSLAGLALAPLLDGRLKFIPERYAKTYQTWLENLRDWPISRQLWWGHRIPVWSLYFTHAEYVQDFQPDNLPQGHQQIFEEFLNACKLKNDVVFCWSEELKDGTYPLYVCVRNEQADTALDMLCRLAKHQTNQSNIKISQYAKERSDFEEKFGREALTSADKLKAVFAPRMKTKSVGNKESQGRDPDVLDTWFSSALWPFSTLGWPDETPELKKFYPTNVLSTAREIITLWVSRMVMMGQYCVGDIPFGEVFIHAMIQDGQGRKMSKSLGNGVDPLEVIDTHGADAMRYTLVSMTTQTQDVRMPLAKMKLPDGREVNSSPKFDIGRNLCNKLWNASRFVLSNLLRCPPWSTIHPTENLTDTWILSRLNTAIRDATISLEGYRFNELTERLYHFLWDDFCDWYLEIAKIRIAAGDRTPKAILAHTLDIVLRLLHPICPFITEAIWERLNLSAATRGPGDTPAENLLVLARWPMADGESINPPAEAAFEMLSDLIRQIRNVRTQHNVPPSRKTDVLVEAVEGSPSADILLDNIETVRSLGWVGELKISFEAIVPPADAAALSTEGLKLYVCGIMDRQAERVRLEKQRSTLTVGIAGIEGKLANENFLAKAPPDVVERERQRLEKLKRDLAAIG